MTEAERPWAQLALVVGGLCWIGWSLATIVTGSADGSVRFLVGASGFVLAVGLLGVVLRLPWIYQFPGGEGCGVTLLGGLAFAAGQWSRVLLGGAGWFAEGVVALGVLGLAVGTALLAAGVVRARRVPPWLGVALFVGTVLFLGFGNGDGLRAWLAPPLGLAWLALGGYLLRYPEQPSGHLEPSAISR
ncbi:hypothetical protein [Halomicrobium sp. LC1Hm]|uniref:hypothetical protein n=1 Tax=Halomicrobium sp. LC1Hm TaxID=2610902 RepID=UPI0012983ECB|nr:hypothetical protein [Halomicrobium sp. LC1Hm]QGA83535.1 putative membrane protein [Halomicrobium sp. LC1Hm]